MRPAGHRLLEAKAKFCQSSSGSGLTHAGWWHRPGSRSLHPPDLLGPPSTLAGRRGHAAVGERLGQLVQGARPGPACGL